MRAAFSAVMLLCVGCMEAKLDEAQARLQRAQETIARLSATEMPVLLREVTHLQEVLDRSEHARIQETRRAEAAEELLASLPVKELPEGLTMPEKRALRVNPSDMRSVERAIQDLEVRAGRVPVPAPDEDRCPREVSPVTCRGETPMLVCESPDGAWLVSTHIGRAQAWSLPSGNGMRWSVLHRAAPSMVVLARTSSTGTTTAHVLWLARSAFPLAGFPLDGGGAVRVADLDGDGQEDVLWTRGSEMQAVVQDGGPAMAHVLDGAALKDLCGPERGASALARVCGS